MNNLLGTEHSFYKFLIMSSLAEIYEYSTDRKLYIICTNMLIPNSDISILTH